jgi:hypothetical protein
VTETLLDASDTGRRLLQQGLALTGGAALLAGVLVLAMMHAAHRAVGGLAIAAGVVLIVAACCVLVQWEVRYEGHIVRFENSVLFGERLVIDGERVTRGALGYRKVLEGTIQRGSKAGRRVRAESVAGPLRFRCRILIESA